MDGFGRHVDHNQLVSLGVLSSHEVPHEGTFSMQKRRDARVLVSGLKLIFQW